MLDTMSSSIEIENAVNETVTIPELFSLIESWKHRVASNDEDKLIGKNRWHYCLLS